MTRRRWWRWWRHPDRAELARSPVLRSGRSPHEVIVLLVAALFGILGVTLGADVSPTLVAALGQPWASIYFLGMAASAIITLGGLAQHRLEGLLIERGGLIAQAFLFAGYGGALLNARGWAGLAAAALPFGIAASHIARILQIRHDLRLLPTALRRAVDLRDSDPGYPPAAGPDTPTEGR